ncbi:hypothetical protein CMT41_10605 [Colwellia sp. MT41]|uniref:WecB/TagA/CpsF family glycosyltransferase n=1 Tax=Colwellia sp. MT41 TaxID=58049 RepID=UPI000717B574|nr:WecB/TagA/CpsF family glycosyltransferase [Colwellia sp. MT41]ALO35118.1 hypothetical protein CMT41_10605 [Colwellia sp. MT41]
MQEIKVGNLQVAIFADKKAILSEMYSRLSSNLATAAVAVNPEKVLSALSSHDVAHVLNQCDIRYADGIGVVKVLQHKSGMKLQRIPGCELWESLMKEAGIRNTPVFLLGATEDVLTKTRRKLVAEYETPIAGYHNGFFQGTAEMIQKIKDSGAQIVTVALGSPKQELFIFECKKAGIKAIFMGVGGTYDVYTGNVKRAPKMFCKFGLEWFYRLCNQPSRIIRQLKLLSFVWLAVTNKL